MKILPSLLVLACLGITPALVASAAREVPRSPHYGVQIIEDGAKRDLFVHYSRAQKPDSNRSEDVSWASFTVEDPVTVSVSVPNRVFTRARVLPSSREIVPTVEGNRVTFVVDRPGQLAIEFDEDIAHPLFLFGDPPEAALPDPNDPDVIWFGPGIHDLGERFIEPKAGQTVYLAAGATVYGRIKIADAPGVKIRGRGILRGGHLPANPPNTYSVPHALEADAASPGVTVEGITLVESPHYNILLRGENCTVRNVKLLGWWFGTDGVGLGRRGLVEDSFLRCNDDALKLYNSGMIVRRCVIWQMENGAPFQLSWNMNPDNASFHVSDIDIIRVDHHQHANNRAIFNAIHGGSAHLKDYLFEDIRIENAQFRFMLLQIRKTNWSKAVEWGRLSHITLRNVTATGPFSERSAIRSDHPDGRIDHVVFENVKIDSKWVTAPSGLQLDIDPVTTSEITFVRK